MEPFQYQDGAIPHLTLPSWEKRFPHLIVGMSARKPSEEDNGYTWNYALHVEDDPTHVVENRVKLMDMLNLPISSWTCGEQVHGTHIHEVTKEEGGRGSTSQKTAFTSTDGLLTCQENLLLTSFYADCVPLIFYSPATGWLGIAHAGWRGTTSGIGSQMVHQLVQRGADPEEIHVAIAPSIGGCCYEVDEPVIMALTQILVRPSEKVVTPAGRGKWKLDLRQANREILLNEGIRPEHLLVTQLCTSCRQDLFYSYRRDRGKVGRMVAWIGRRKDRNMACSK